MQIREDFGSLYKGGNDLIIGESVAIGTITIDDIEYTRYKKIIDFGTLPDGTSEYTIKNVSADLPNDAKVISLSGIGVSSDVATALVLPNPNASANLVITLGYVNRNITIGTSTNRSNLHGYVTIEYYC